MIKITNFTHFTKERLINFKFGSTTGKSVFTNVGRD